MPDVKLMTNKLVTLGDGRVLDVAGGSEAVDSFIQELREKNAQPTATRRRLHIEEPLVAPSLLCDNKGTRADAANPAFGAGVDEEPLVAPRLFEERDES